MFQPRALSLTMQQEFKSAMLLVIVTVLRVPPVENASSILAIVRLLASLEPYESSRDTASRGQTCKCDVQLPTREQLSVPDLMKDIQRWRELGVSAESIRKAVQLSLDAPNEVDLCF